MTFPPTRIGVLGPRRPGGLLRLAHTHWFQRSGFLAALIGALLLQSVLVGAHVHADQTPVVSATTSHAGSTPSDRHDEAPQKSCLLCDQGALDGHGLVPDPVGLLVVACAAPFLAIAASGLLDVASISHLWQSRAPPR